MNTQTCKGCRLAVILAEVAVEAASPSPFSTTTWKIWDEASKSLGEAVLDFADAEAHTFVGLGCMEDARAALESLAELESREGHSSHVKPLIESLKALINEIWEKPE